MGVEGLKSYRGADPLSLVNELKHLPSSETSASFGIKKICELHCVLRLVRV